LRAHQTEAEVLHATELLREAIRWNELQAGT